MNANSTSGKGGGGGTVRSNQRVAGGGPPAKQVKPPGRETERMDNSKD
jgi:hypothetical protein